MIDSQGIMPFNYFKYGGRYSGEHKGMKYLIVREGDKPDFILKVYVWRGPYCKDVTPIEDIESLEFDYSEEGRDKAIGWIMQLYEDKKSYWDEAPSILKAKPVIHE